MTKKYIIKNCPAFIKGDPRPHKCKAYERGICHTKSNCLLKQIVEKCKSDTCKIVEAKTNKFLGYRTSPLAQEILSMLEIEECGE